MAIKNLSIIGTDIDTLTAACEFALKQMSISVKSFFIDNKQHAIVFKETTNEEDPGRFPIDVTPVILREVIWRFLEQQSDDVYEKSSIRLRRRLVKSVGLVCTGLVF